VGVGVIYGIFSHIQGRQGQGGIPPALKSNPMGEMSFWSMPGFEKYMLRPIFLPRLDLFREQEVGDEKNPSLPIGDDS